MVSIYSNYSVLKLENDASFQSMYYDCQTKLQLVSGKCLLEMYQQLNQTYSEQFASAVSNSETLYPVQ